MKTLHIALLISLFGTALSAQQFEGVIEMTQKVGTNVRHITWWFKSDGRLAMETREKDPKDGYEYTIKAIPQLNANTLLVHVLGKDGVHTLNVPFSEIKADEELISDVKIAEQELTQSQWGSNVAFTAKTATGKNISGRLLKVENLNLKSYAQVLKSDLVFAALTSVGASGFPQDCSIISAGGERLMSLNVTKFQAESVSEEHFQ